MRMHRDFPRPAVRAACITGIAVAILAGCRGPAVRTSPASIRVACPASGDLVQCFEPASALCGREGYDLFDRRGRRATVGDARYGTLEARCRDRRQPGQ